MLFSSIEFLYIFLPPVLIVFLVLRQLRLETAIIFWLIAASLLFYAWWNPKYLLLIIASVIVNFALHLGLLERRSKGLLIFGITMNLAVLGVFKYADFILQNVGIALGTEIARLNLLLPLAISFFTFQQISFLVDTYKGCVERTDFKRYILFVTFFPQLIAGPIIRHSDTIAQFKFDGVAKSSWVNIALGMTLFSIGMFKKLVLADGIAPVANGVFNGVEGGALVSTADAWLAALAYTFQLYFDFSGYCDMALGLARMFGIKLPINFNSPYKSRSITEFWRRWHISLSRFLRDYLYIPLGGNRSGVFGHTGNLLITMLLGGLWHGAGWTFLVWGAVHGAFLMAHQAWLRVRDVLELQSVLPTIVTQAIAWALTMLVVVVAWVFFRAESIGTAFQIVQAMFGFATSPAYGGTVAALVVDRNFACTALATMFLIVTGLPNSIEFVRRYRPVLATVHELVGNQWGPSRLTWQPSSVCSVMVGAILIVSIVQMYRLNELTEFLYFNF